MGQENLSAVVIADSISPDGHRLTTLEVTFPRFLLAEFNSYRAFCLAGDSLLEFEIPARDYWHRNYVRRMSLGEFVAKWNRRSSVRPNQERVLHKVDPNCEYPAHDVVGRVRGRTRFAVQDRLRALAIRQLDEKSKQITLTHIQSAVFSGEKEVFEVTLANGSLVAGSRDHRVFTAAGWKAIGLLTLDDLVWVSPHRSVLPHCVLSQVVSKVSRGVEPTYDLTVEGPFANFLANGVVVHNSRSSVVGWNGSVASMMSWLADKPAVPLVWSREQPDIQGGDDIADPGQASQVWLAARDDAVCRAEQLCRLGVHRSIVIRLLEPYMMCTVVVSATDWEGFWAQHCSPQAQPEMRAVAMAMQVAYVRSVPKLES